MLIGGGGHCHSVLDTICSNGNYKKIGIVAKDKQNLNELKEDPFIAPYLVGIDVELPVLFSEGWDEAFVTLGSIGNPIGRKMVFSNILDIGFQIPVIKDNRAAISKYSVIEKGVFIGKNVVVNAGSMVGTCAILNTGAIVEHDCVIGSFVHVSPGTTLCGAVIVEEDTHIGAGSVIKQGITVGRGSLIGIGSVVVKDIPANVKAYGNPCRVVE